MTLLDDVPDPNKPADIPDPLPSIHTEVPLGPAHRFIMDERHYLLLAELVVVQANDHGAPIGQPILYAPIGALKG